METTTLVHAMLKAYSKKDFDPVKGNRQFRKFYIALVRKDQQKDIEILRLKNQVSALETSMGKMVDQFKEFLPMRGELWQK